MDRTNRGTDRQGWRIEPALSPHHAELGTSGLAPVVSIAKAYAVEPHVHDCDMIFIPLSGRFSIEQDTVTPLRVRPGYFLWVPASHAHATYSYSERQRHLTVYVDRDVAKDALRANGVRGMRIGLRAASSALNHYASELALHAGGSAGYARAAQCGALMQEAARLHAAAPLLPEPPMTADHAILLAEQIDRDLCEPLDIEAFARCQRLSRRQVERIFQDHFQVAPLAYQQQQRLQRALLLLRETGYSVHSIAQQVGWSSGSYLAKMLSRTYGVTPSLLRAK